MTKLFINSYVYFRARGAENLKSLGIRAGIFIIGASLVLAVATYLNFEPVEARYDAGAFLPAGSAWTMAFQRLLFPLAWAMIILYSSTARFIFARLQQVDQIDFRVALYVSLYAAMPLILIGFLLGLYYSFLPYERTTGVGATISLLAVFTAYACEGVACTSGFEILGGLSRIRAILMWLAPVLITFFFCGPALTILIVIRSI